MSETNPLLVNLKLPGRTFQLPSRGLFYKDGELDSSCTDGEIHVQPLSALDEINLKNPDQLFSGTAIDLVVRQCVPAIKKPTQLLSKDVDALLMFLRAATYGSSYEFMAKHTCEGAKDHSYVADLDEMIGRMKMIDPTIINEHYSLTLQNGQTVRLRPHRYAHMLELIKANENKKVMTVDDQRDNLKRMVMSVIDQVDNISDRDKILEWMSRIPSPMLNKIANRVENINEWGPDVSWTCKCRDCGEEFKIDIPINPVSFFTE